MNWTYDLLENLQSIEDALDALENGYYDSYDLCFIEQHKEEYEDELRQHACFLPVGASSFNGCEIKEGELVAILRPSPPPRKTLCHWDQDPRGERYRVIGADFHEKFCDNLNDEK